MASFYPHRSTAIIFIVCILLVSAVGYYSFASNSKVQLQEEPQVSITQKIAPDDSDIEAVLGSKKDDWRKEFNGQYFASSSLTKKSTGSSADDENLTVTDQFGRSFFTHYLELKQAGLLTNKDLVTTMNNQALTTSLGATSAKVYSQADIKIATADDAISAKTYATAIGRILALYHAPRNEAMITKESLTKQDPSILTQIDPIIASYQSMITAFKATPTPPAYAKSTLGLLNGISAMKFTAESLRETTKDPMRGLTGVSVYLTGLQKFIDALRDLNNSLTAQGITLEIDPAMLQSMLNIQQNQ